ncbi:hypothetical protein G6F43_011359 [Rhizopus delemar]|nr:hypothetical protein G6F43_011359 [Rhizopus delemar]
MYAFALDHIKSSKLTLESHTHHLLGLSSIVLLTRSSNPYSDNCFLQKSAKDIRWQMLTRLGMHTRKFTRVILMELLDIVKCLQIDQITRVDAATGIQQYISRLDQYGQKLIKYLQRCIEELPYESPSNDVLETKLCSRYLLTVFRSAFEDMQDSHCSVEFDFTGVPTEESSEQSINITKKRPDGVFNVASKSVGFVEVKPLCQSKFIQKINLDLYRLGIFCKNAIHANRLKMTMAAQAVGNNITFYIVQNFNGVCTMTEIWHQRFPASIAELPSFLGFFDEFLDVVAIFFTGCVNNNICTENTYHSPVIRTPVLKAVVAKSSNNKRRTFSQKSYY